MIDSMLLALFFGIFVAEIITGRPQGPFSALTNYPNQKFPSLFIGFGHSNIEHAYHIHHWIWGTILLIISLIYGNIWFSTILLGIVVEGLLYSDRFVI